MLVTTLCGSEMHEVPSEERVGQGHVGVNASGRKRVAVEVHAFFEIASFGDAPIARDGMMTDIGEEEQVAMPVMQSLTEVDAGTVQRVDERSFHQARFVDRPARTVIRACRPFDHPVEDFKLAELRLPLRDAFGAQVIDKGVLARSRTYRE